MCMYRKDLSRHVRIAYLTYFLYPVVAPLRCFTERDKGLCGSHSDLQECTLCKTIHVFSSLWRTVNVSLGTQSLLLVLKTVLWLECCIIPLGWIFKFSLPLCRNNSFKCAIVLTYRFLVLLLHLIIPSHLRWMFNIPLVWLSKRSSYSNTVLNHSLGWVNCT